MKIKIKKLNKNAVIPSYAKPGDAAVDLYAISKDFNEEFGFLEYGTGLAIEIPEGHVGLIFPRSSISTYNLELTNAVGVIDSQYRGEIKFRFKPDYLAAAHMLGDELNIDIRGYEPGERVGQLIVMPYPQIEFQEVKELSSTERGKGGFGSSGN